ncbi:hypothetical protein C8J57DRAFT_1325235 [Mycena rebaudengoi]|nr:hypothetical protein C8J57DRAFT_1325235 [Mycena rebaudengoi]
MLSSIIFISALIASASAAARPWNGTQPRDIGVHCGTTQDASLSDCNNLINNWDSLYNADSGSCHFVVAGNVFDFGKALTVACSGTCCVYVTGFCDPSDLPDKEQIKSEAQGLLGCADKGKGLINGMHQFESDRHATCVGGRNGCGDCFDDSDYDYSVVKPAGGTC